jgi:hypothetical protein
MLVARPVTLLKDPSLCEYRKQDCALAQKSIPLLAVSLSTSLAAAHIAVRCVTPGDVALLTCGQAIGGGAPSFADHDDSNLSLLQELVFVFGENSRNLFLVNLLVEFAKGLLAGEVHLGKAVAVQLVHFSSES